MFSKRDQTGGEINLTSNCLRTNVTNMQDLFHLIFQLDEYLIQFVADYGWLAYIVFFLMVFCESGLIPMIFLPGDGFLFALGVIAATGALQLSLLLPLLILAAVLGYILNYELGRKMGEILLAGKWKRWIKPVHLERSRRFFDKHGERAIFLGRFVPVVRTIIPFLAGIAAMRRGPFLRNAVLGGILWMSLFVTAGYLLGEIPFVKQNFLFIYFGMMAATTVPITVGMLFNQYRGKQK